MKGEFGNLDRLFEKNMLLGETMLSRYHFNRRVVHLVNEGAQSALDAISEEPPSRHHNGPQRAELLKS